MNSGMLEWLRAEATHQGLDLTDADLAAVYERLARIKAALAAVRPTSTEDVEPALHFAPPTAPPNQAPPE